MAMTGDEKAGDGLGMCRVDDAITLRRTNAVVERPASDAERWRHLIGVLPRETALPVPEGPAVGQC